MNKQQLLDALLESLTKCKNFHFQCFAVTLLKEEMEYLISLLNKEINLKKKYTLIVNRDGKEFSRLKFVSLAETLDGALKIQAEIEKNCNWFYTIEQKKKYVILHITTHKEHPYGDY